MGTRISRRGTIVLILSSDAGLIRLARSILKPACTVIGRASLDPNANIRDEQADIVVIDAESLDQDVISTARIMFATQMRATPKEDRVSPPE